MKATMPSRKNLATLMVSSQMAPSRLSQKFNFTIPEWKTFKAMGLCSSLLHRVTSRVLIGTELCRNEEYVSSSMKFSESVFMNGIIMSAIPLGPFRRLVAWVGSFNHRRNLRKVMNLLVPVVEKRIRDQAAGIDQSIHNDATQWSIELAEKTPKEGNPERIAHQILQNLWAGSGAPGGMVTQMVYQTLMYPEYVEPMRAEVRKSVDEFGWTDKALSSMKLVDSFIKETNRMYPNGSSKSEKFLLIYIC
jgi:aspirochlorine biosynthesis cytochrome P450 monooxygenase